jgi:hypothetical protein
MPATTAATDRDVTSQQREGGEPRERKAGGSVAAPAPRPLLYLRLTSMQSTRGVPQ